MLFLLVLLGLQRFCCVLLSFGFCWAYLGFAMFSTKVFPFVLSLASYQIAFS